MGDTYTHGHHASVLKSHNWRTLANSAAYLIPHLTRGSGVLDVGCGPGNLTAEMAERVAPAPVIGVDYASVIVDAAQQTHQRRNLSFAVGDVYGLNYPDNSFDVVHAHQVLQHLTDPVAALQEMMRVTRPGGLLAVRDADYEAMQWFPEPHGLDRWRDLYLLVARSNGAEPSAGRRLLSWAHEAGLSSIVPSADTWCFATPDDREWWSSLWAERTVKSSFGHQAVERGLATEAELRNIADAWRLWGREADGWFIVPNAELICRV